MNYPGGAEQSASGIMDADNRYHHRRMASVSLYYHFYAAVARNANRVLCTKSTRTFGIICSQLNYQFPGSRSMRYTSPQLTTLNTSAKANRAMIIDSNSTISEGMFYLAKDMELCGCALVSWV